MRGGFFTKFATLAHGVAAAIATPPPVIQLKCIKTLHSAAASFLGLGLSYGVRLRLEF